MTSAVPSELEGPVRIVAGAGTGKTAVIARRFASLVEAGIDAASILVMTFTERAATEMGERIQGAISSPAGVLNVGTFHSLAQGWLREDGWRIGIPRTFTILAGPERWIVMRELLWELGEPALVEDENPDRLVTPLLRMLERMKQELVPIRRLRAWAATTGERDRGRLLAAVARLFEAYGEHCRRERQLDFDDLMAQAVRLFAAQPGVLDSYQRRFRWVMVDEYQDTNLAQERVVEQIAAGHGNVCVVGDDDQSIYRFRGASRANLERFQDSFPAASTHALGRNRRSTQSIVEAARRLIEHNPGRLAKELSSTRERGEPVRLQPHRSGEAEAESVASEIAGLRRQGLELSRVAVLTRTHAILRPLLRALESAELPYQLWGARGFYDQPEIRDLLAHLRLIDDPRDELALARVLTRPPLSVDGEMALSSLARARASGAAPLEALEGSGAVGSWLRTIRDLVALKGTMGVEDLFFELMSRTGYLEVSAGMRSIERAQVLANVDRFTELIGEYCTRGTDHRLPTFMAHLRLVLLSGVNDELPRVETGEAAVQVMTIHQAKGLEFDAVFIPSVVEGRLPQRRREDRLQLPSEVVDSAEGGREDQLGEERRLLYVAMTRARDRLNISWAEIYEGGRRWSPSRFIAEIETAGDVVLRQEQEDVAPPHLHLPREGGGVEVDGAAPTLSFSAVSTYRECPRHYWFRYVHRLPAVPSPEAAYGTLVHEALAGAGRLRQQGTPVTADELRDLNGRLWAGPGFPDQRRRPALEALSLLQLERYRAEGGLDPVPHVVEHAFEVALDGWRLRGVIDRVDPPAAAGGAWRLIDYKTGAAIPRSRLRRDLQLSLYALGVQRALGLEPLELELVYLREGRRTSVPASRELLSTALEIGSEAAASIRAGDFEARPQPRRCQLCPYRLACPAAL